MTAYGNTKISRSMIWKALLVPTGISILCISLYALTNFLLFHIVVEFFSILVGITALTVSTTSNEFTKNQFIIFLAIALGWCSVLDFIHTIVYEGMNLVPGHTPTQSSQFWIMARFLQAFSFLISPIFLFRKYPLVPIHLCFITYTGISCLLIFTGHFPITYVLQTGVTEFKFLAELFIILILIISCGVYYNFRSMIAKNLFYPLLASMLTMILSEMVFSKYLSLIGFENILGHLIKLYSYWFIYIALVFMTLREPFNQLSRSASNYNAVPEPAIIMNQNGIIYQANEAAAEFAQTTQEALVGRSSHAVFHNPTIAADLCPVCQKLNEKQQHELLEVDRDQDHWVECKLSPIESDFYNDAWIQVIRDISVRKQLELEKNIAIHDLGERIKELCCMNTISALSVQEDLTIPVLLHKSVNALADAFQYPEMAGAKIVSNWGTFTAGLTFTEDTNILEQTITCQGKEVGVIKIGYSTPNASPPLAFLPEEYMLINSIVSFISSLISQLLIKEKNQQITYLYEMLSAINHAALRCQNNEELLAGLFEAMQKFGHLDTIVIAKSTLDVPKYKIIHSMGVSTDLYSHLDDEITNYIDTLDEASYAALLTGEVITPKKHLKWSSNNLTNQTETPELIDEFIIPLLYENQLQGLIYIKGMMFQISKNEIEILLNELSTDASFALSRFEAIKSRILAEKRAKKSEYRFIEVFMAAPIPIIVINRSHEKLQRMNKAFIKWTGYSENEALRQSQWIQHVLGEVYSLLHDQGESTVDAKEIKILNKHKEERTVLVSSLSIGKDFIVFFSDITDIRAQEKELIQKENTFRQIIEQPNIGIYVRDQNQFIYTNKTFCDLVGYSAEELKNKGLADLIINDPSTQSFIKQIWGKVTQPGQTINYEIPFERKDGKQIVLAINGTSIIRNGALAIVAFVQDITITEQARQQTEYYIKKLEHAIKGTFIAISNMVEARDPYTSGHEHRVATIAKRIAQELGLPNDRCNAIELIGLVHDIGKIAVPSEILSKPGRLSSIEMELVKSHAEAGYTILKDVEFDFPVAESIWQHHERLDGSGYPRGLKGDEILLEARIIAVADVIEAMSSHRPYRAALGLEMAIEEINKGRETRYDPVVVDALLKLIHENNNQLPISRPH